MTNMVKADDYGILMPRILYESLSEFWKTADLPKYRSQLLQEFDSQCEQNSDQNSAYKSCEPLKQPTSFNVWFSRLLNLYIIILFFLRKYVVHEQ